MSLYAYVSFDSMKQLLRTCSSLALEKEIIQGAYNRCEVVSKVTVDV